MYCVTYKYCIKYCTIFKILFAVFRCFLARVLDITTFDPEMGNPPNVTLHQLFTYFKNQELPDINDYLLDIAGESKLQLDLFSII